MRESLSDQIYDQEDETMATYPMPSDGDVEQRHCALCGAVYVIPFDLPYCSVNCREVDARFRRLRDQMFKERETRDDADQKPIDPQTTSDQE